MEDGFFVLLGLAALAAFALGPIGFFMALGARNRLSEAQARLSLLDARVKELESGRAAPSSAPPAPEAAAIVAETEPVAEPIATESAPPEEIALPVEPSAPSGSADASPRPSRSFEEAFGTRWTVWVGGIALALGALLLVRYSIEQGFFGPGVRILMGLALAIGLVGGGEWMRRRESADAPSQPGLPVSAVLTAAGTVAAFGSIYAAHALYGFIGPAVAFVLLGATGVATMFAAALHGPALAGLGLAASLATPLIVDSNDPNPWPVVPYLAVVAASAYALARLRLWLWLALAAAFGGGLWGLAFLPGADNHNSNFFQAAVVHICIQAAMACFVFCWTIHRRTPDEAAAPDRLANQVPAGFALLMAIALAVGAAGGHFGLIWMIGASALIALLAGVAVFVSPAAPLAAVAGFLVFVALRVWPADDSAEAIRAVTDLTRWSRPAVSGQFGAMALLWGAEPAGSSRGACSLARACRC